MSTSEFEEAFAAALNEHAVEEWPLDSGYVERRLYDFFKECLAGYEAITLKPVNVRQKNSSDGAFAPRARRSAVQCVAAVS
jgi:hypothetical protein